MQKKDYYEVLGISKNADAADIKKSFRTLARKYHPDINKEAGAEEKFKEVNEAYEVLSDEKKRQLYDQYGHQGLEQNGFYSHDARDIFNQFFSQEGGGFGGNFFEDLFGQSGFFGQGGPSRSSRNHNPNQIERDIEISFVDSIKGCRQNFRYSYYQQCNDCKGNGALNGDERYFETCSKCNGSGEQYVHRRTIFGEMNQAVTCQKCQGKKRVVSKSCKTCKGYGHIEQSQQTELSIPQGIDNGQTLVFKTNHSGTEVTLIIRVHVAQSSVFERHGLNIYTKIIINPLHAITGADVKIASPWGIKTIRIKPGVKNGEHLKVPNSGVKVTDSSKKTHTGDLIGIVEYGSPPILTKDQIEELKKIKTAPSKEAEIWMKKAVRELN